MQVITHWYPALKFSFWLWFLLSSQCVYPTVFKWTLQIRYSSNLFFTVISSTKHNLRLKGLRSMADIPTSAFAHWAFSQLLAVEGALVKTDQFITGLLWAWSVMNRSLLNGYRCGRDCAVNKYANSTNHCADSTVNCNLNFHCANNLFQEK